MGLERNPNVFANNPLDRAGNHRSDREWLAAQRAHKDAAFAVLWQLKPLLQNPNWQNKAGDGPPSEVCWLTSRAIDALGLNDPPVVLLGRDGETPYFAVDISAMADPERNGPLAGLGVFSELRGAAGALSGDDIAILGQAKAMLDWHARHGFCACCGAKTTLSDAGYRRICTECAAEHFPRTDPVVIMLATFGERALLGRQKQFPPSLFTALAGFMEPGESIEEAVARELKEEADVDVKAVRYLFTQPWPFPSSLMIGCIAEADTDAITVDGIELAEARWFTRAEITKALDRPLAPFDPARRMPTGNPGELLVPPPFAIAHQIMKQWIAES